MKNVKRIKKIKQTILDYNVTDCGELGRWISSSPGQPEKLWNLRTGTKMRSGSAGWTVILW